MAIRIAGGAVYDPANGIDGEVRDIWIAAAVVAAVRAGRPTASTPRGMVVMPGGVDMHCHIAGPKVNTARKMLPEEQARTACRTAPDDHAAPARGGSVPSTFATGYKYAGLGYTTAFDAAIPPLAARHAHEEFDDTPCIDKGFFVLMGNNHYVMRAIRRGRARAAARFIAWLLGATGAMRVKLVNPGGVEVWKRGARQRAPGSTRRRPTSASRRGRSSTTLARRGGRARAAAPGPHPLQQPRACPATGDDAGDMKAARRPPRPT